MKTKQSKMRRVIFSLELELDAEPKGSFAHFR